MQSSLTYICTYTIQFQSCIVLKILIRSGQFIVLYKSLYFLIDFFPPSFSNSFRLRGFKTSMYFSTSPFISVISCFVYFDALLLQALTELFYLPQELISFITVMVLSLSLVIFLVKISVSLLSEYARPLMLTSYMIYLIPFLLFQCIRTFIFKQHLLQTKYY